MNTVTHIQKWQTLRNNLSGNIAFIPTMGNLHTGHMALIERAKKENDIVVVSIFVNPTQFNDAADFEKYQRTLKEDAILLKKAGVDYLLCPTEKEMYPENYEVQITETIITKELEGACRPGHFEGVMTIVLKLLNLVRPTRAYFGEKDFQQLQLIEKMCKALFLNTEIIPCAIVRADSGLALSSRNSRLSPEQQTQAAQIYALLQSPENDNDITEKLNAAGFKTEYVATKWDRRLCAVWLGDVRLIDNIPLPKEMEKQNAAMS